MADPADIGNDTMQADLERRIAAARGEIIPGRPGDCDLCGEWSGRLLEGACAPCRDKHDLR